MVPQGPPSVARCCTCLGGVRGSPDRSTWGRRRNLWLIGAFATTPVATRPPPLCLYTGLTDPVFARFGKSDTGWSTSRFWASTLRSWASASSCRAPSSRTSWAPTYRTVGELSRALRTATCALFWARTMCDVSSWGLRMAITMRIADTSTAISPTMPATRSGLESRMRTSM